MSTSSLAGHSILVVDDHDPTRNLLVSFLLDAGCEVDAASGGEAALAKLSEKTFDLVVLDLRMDDLDGLEVMRRARELAQKPRFIMMSAEGTISHAVDAIRLGASDFLVKPFELEQLSSTAERVLGVGHAKGASMRDPRLLWRDRYAPNLIGEDPSLLEVFLVLERIANTDCTVLVLGESGTGKELVARALHNASGRATRDFVPVNCGAIPETLIESELFGHAKGAFSGATSTREGRFAVADKGTLFLDEIGEMSLAVQVKFLRVLQEGEYVPVGETKPRKCDVRIIAATNKHLEEMAEQGTFREDLFYRLNLIPIHLPALRERRSDIPRLVYHFIDVFNKRRGCNIEGVDPGAMELLAAYHWPGNIRELENTVERMTLLHTGTGQLQLADLPAKIQQLSRGSKPSPAAVAASMSPPLGTHVGAPVPATPSDTPVPADPNITSVDMPIPAALRAQAAAATGTTAVPPTAESSSPGTAPPGTPDGVPATYASDTAAPIAVSEAPASPARPQDFRLPDGGMDLRKAVEQFEMSLIDQALERTGGNKNQASILLGMNRTTLVEKLRKRQRQAGARASS